MPLNPQTRTPTDPEGKRTYGHQILHLTDRLTGAETYEQAAEATEHVLDEADGVLPRLSEFFEAAAEEARSSGVEEGFELACRFEDAAATLTDLSDELHGASDQMRALGPPPEPRWQAQVARYYAAVPQRPGPARRTSAVRVPPAAQVRPEHAPQPRHHR
ncbi:hypothetical protein [Streptomyces reniochalinae]|uniref:Uncharacterized protein n=1 Tax=Streptomyces reniochalinae TaxID=2250578 RepID=A0A367F0Q5_9ACTN|nr:hypothetical protein [Streptomyces reniochalinae]RCG23913.1 hypothetical protein DQ392_04355 [Streptomyces reniochalinae]